MSPISARMAIPCIDEPARKSIFRMSITISIESNLMVITNMPESKVESGAIDINGSKVVHFMDTPLMST